MRQDAISQFPGAVIERSGSGSSVYMEPHSLMSLNNEYSKLYGEEMLEETRIFREFTARLIKRKKGILDTENVLAPWDLFYALSETARLDKWHMPDLSKRTEFSFVPRAPSSARREVRAYRHQMRQKFRILVITGPNTGGKTVALQTAGVCIYFGWLGFPVPAGEGSVLGDIGELFATSATSRA